LKAKTVLFVSSKKPQGQAEYSKLRILT